MGFNKLQRFYHPKCPPCLSGSLLRLCGGVVSVVWVVFGGELELLCLNKAVMLL